MTLWLRLNNDLISGNASDERTSGEEYSKSKLQGAEWMGLSSTATERRLAAGFGHSTIKSG
jgi:hypothetical protein